MTNMIIQCMIEHSKALLPGMVALSSAQLNIRV